MSKSGYEQYADDDPEYAGDADAAADAAADVDAQLTEFEPTDPATVPPDEGDAGQPGPPGGAA